MTNVHPLREDGVALPLTVFLVAVLTILLTASFSRISNEVQLADGSNDMVTAFSVAQSGLNSYGGLARDVRPLDGDSMRINVVGGYADVVAHLVRNDTLSREWTYLIQSTGRVVHPAAGPEPRAVHTVAQFAKWQWGNPATPGAWTSVWNIVRSSTLPPGVNPDITVSGIDACGVAPTIAGINARTVNDTTGFTTFGSPPVATQGTASAVSALTGIDWQAILGGAINADSDSLIPNDTTYRTYHINGDISTTDVRGTGLLIVTGRLTTNGNYFEWDGMVVLGDVIRQNATDSTVIRGLLVTGLNWQSSDPYSVAIADDRPIFIYYDSCKIKRSVQSVRGFVPIQNGWFDHWTTY